MRTKVAGWLAEEVCPVKLRDEHDDGLIVAAFDAVGFQLRPEPAGEVVVG
jgi:hypothetical protein